MGTAGGRLQAVRRLPGDYWSRVDQSGSRFRCIGQTATAIRTPDAELARTARGYRRAGPLFHAAIQFTVRCDALFDASRDRRALGEGLSERSARREGDGIRATAR